MLAEEMFLISFSVYARSFLLEVASMKTKNELTRTIVEVGIFAAIGFVLDEIQGIILANVFTAGGSIGFAMVAVLIIAYRRGWLPAICTGLIMGLLDLITKSYIITFWQVLLDYLLPYALVGFAGLFKPWFDKEQSSGKRILILSLGTITGGLLKFLSHFIVGTLVWAKLGMAWSFKSEALYSFVYNIAFTGPSIILSLAVLLVLYNRVPKLIVNESTSAEFKKNDHIKAFDYVINPTMIITGLFLFVFYLVLYIQNATLKDKGEWGIKLSSNQNAVFLMFTGIVLLLAFGICFFRTMKDKQNNKSTTLVLLILSASHIVYAIAKILYCYFDDWEDPKIYFIWMVLAFIANCIFIGVYLIIKQIYTKKEDVISTN